MTNPLPLSEAIKFCEGIAEMREWRAAHLVMESDHALAPVWRSEAQAIRHLIELAKGAEKPQTDREALMQGCYDIPPLCLLEAILWGVIGIAFVFGCACLMALNRPSVFPGPELDWPVPKIERRIEAKGERDAVAVLNCLELPKS